MTLNFAKEYNMLDANKNRKIFMDKFFKFDSRSRPKY